MTEKVNGVTLRAVNYKESDKILTVFTLEKGKITVSARGVRKANAKMKQISEPFCFAESIIAEKSGRFTVTEINSFDAFYPIRCDLVKYYAGMTALEITDAFLPDGLESPAHFVLLVSNCNVIFKSKFVLFFHKRNFTIKCSSIFDFNNDKSAFTLKSFLLSISK